MFVASRLESMDVLQSLHAVHLCIVCGCWKWFVFAQKRLHITLFSFLDSLAGVFGVRE